MVEIQCPHCEEDVELKDGASGLFDCPHCDKEFSWGSGTKWTLDNVLKWVKNIGTAIIIIGLILFIIIWYELTKDGSGCGGGMCYDGLAIFLPIGIILLGLSIHLILLAIRVIRKMREESKSTN
tara:strand:+ start:94 stop:465 length:372 start_codon:yes stop_codon:yes gene_type:complete